jgi:hypothetical protein
MKRDMDLIREILLRLEEDDEETVRTLVEKGYAPIQIRYHCWLLLEENLVTGYDVSSKDTPHRQAEGTGLTNAGHDFLDAARNQGLWEDAKRKLQAAGGFSIPIMQQLLTALVKSKLGLD